MRVLVVEDERELLHVVAENFREEGYPIDEAGLAKALVWDYDAILLDLQLPSRDGLSVLRELRRKRNTPVLLLTARDTVSDRVKGLDGGADDYLVKPFALAELTARVRALLRRAADQPSPMMTIGEVSIDTAAKRVRRGTEEAPLTAREHGIVELLVRQCGRVYEHLFADGPARDPALLPVPARPKRLRLAVRE